MSEYAVHVWRTNTRSDAGVSVALQLGPYGPAELLRYFPVPSRASECHIYARRLMVVAKSLNAPFEPAQQTPVSGDTLALRKWYMREVGYDPTSDDPSMTADELRELILGFVVEASVDRKTYVLPSL